MLHSATLANRKVSKLWALLLPAVLLIVAACLLNRGNSNQQIPNATVSRAQISFEAIIVNKSISPQSIPEGMVWIPGGEFSLGAITPHV